MKGLQPLHMLHAVALSILTASFSPAYAQQPMPAEPLVAAANRAVLSQLPFSDRQDFEAANRGFVGTTPNAANPDLYKFVQQDAPPTVNPSLWRQAQLNAVHGLFKIADGVYQVRGFSLANITIVEGATGLIVIDTLYTVDSAREALELYYAHRPRKPVVAVVYTHSHRDHFGGVRGVTSEADVQSGKTTIIAPAGFMRAVVSETVIVARMSATSLPHPTAPATHSLIPRGLRRAAATRNKKYVRLPGRWNSRLPTSRILRTSALCRRAVTPTSWSA